MGYIVTEIKNTNSKHLHAGWSIITNVFPKLRVSAMENNKCVFLKYYFISNYSAKEATESMVPIASVEVITSHHDQFNRYGISASQINHGLAMSSA